MLASNPFRTGIRSYTLIELLIVCAIIALLIMILMPAIHNARSVAYQSTCAANLRTLGQGMQAYTTAFNDWIPGSPNTSGNGAYPNGWRQQLYSGDFYVWDNQWDAYPAVQIFDWASPLMLMLTDTIPQSIPDRYSLSKDWVFRCPSNDWMAKLNHASRIDIETLVPSYATSRFLTYLPLSRQTGISPRTFFWVHPFVPENFSLRIGSFENPATKVFLADSCKVDRSNPRQISNWEYGYTTYGAWLNQKNVDTGSPSLSYRFEVARRQAYRHRGGINMLFFDGHVEFQPEGSSDDNDGFGSGSRQARFWFPTGTDVRRLPSASSFNNTKIIVP